MTGPSLASLGFAIAAALGNVIGAMAVVRGERRIASAAWSSPN